MFEQNEMEKVFWDVPRRILNILNQQTQPITLSKLSFATETSWASVVDTIKYLEQNELIESKKIGRVREIVITKKGKAVAEHMIQINELVKM